MKKRYVVFLLICSLYAGAVLADTSAVNKLLTEYAQQGAVSPDATAGRQLWFKTFTTTGDPVQRSCSTCHGKDLTKNGRHTRTNKLIEPMAPSVNPTRLTKVREIEKWFKRNCKWTLGRECSVKEKADLLVYINQL